MAPDVNWDIIDSVVKGGPKTENEEFMEQAADVLKGVNGTDYQENPEKLLLLFESAKKIMDFREAAVEDILQEQAEQMDDKEHEIRLLQKDIQNERRLGGSIPQDAEYYRAENRRLLESVEMLQDQTQTLKQDLSDAMKERNEFEQENERDKKLIKELKAESKSLRQEVRDYRDIIDNHQQQRFSTRGHEDSDLKEKLDERNQQISDLIAQISQLEEMNRELEEKNKNIQSEMENGHQEMEKMADEYEKMKKVIGVTDHFTDDLHKQNAQLKMQVDDLRDQMKMKSEEEDSIANVVSEKVEEWSKKLQERDQEVAEQSRTIGVLRQRIAAASLDQDRINVERLTKKLEERDQQIKALQANLNQAVNDLEEQTAIVQDLRKDLGTNREVLSYKAQIRDLKAKVAKQETTVQEAESQRSAAESEAQNNDVKLTQALKRIARLESGQYGLTEAVDEIKERNDQIRARDQEIQELTKQINLVEEKLNDVLEENEEYRDRLGVAPRDLEDISVLRKSRALRQQQYRAENQVLLHEVEKLEDERLQLKLQVRLQAQSYTQKAMSEGLHPDDFELINEFIDELKRKRKLAVKQSGPPTRPLTSSLASRRADQAKVSGRDEETERKVRDAQIESSRLQQENKSVASENDQLRVAMQDILNAIKQSQQTPQPTDLFRIQSVERLLHAMEARQVGDGSAYLKGQVDQMTGRNDELRNELQHVRSENVNFLAKNEALLAQVAQLQAENKMLKIVGKDSKGPLSVASLPKNADPTSDDIITALNEHLMQTLAEASRKDKKISEMKEALENVRRQTDVLRHQTHLLYKEHFEEKEKWSASLKSAENKQDQLHEQHEKNQVRLDEYERLLETLRADPDEMKQRLAETSRKVTLLRVNEKTLIRKHRALEATEDLLTAQNTRLRGEITQMEKAVSERIGYLERHKAMAAFKINALQKAVENSVPESELTLVNRRFDDLTSKYRDLLQKENQFVAKNVTVEALQEEIKIITEEAEVLRQELTVEKEKRHVLEERVRKSNASKEATSRSGKLDPGNMEMSSALKKLPGKRTTEVIAAALAKIVLEFNHRVRELKFLKGKFVFLSILLIVLQVIQIILVQTVTFPQIVFNWLFTTFSAITVAAKLLEEFLPLRKDYKTAKDDCTPYYQGKLRLEYISIADAANGRLDNFDNLIADLTGEGDHKVDEFDQ